MTLSLEIRWLDEDSVELVARCTNGAFCGEAELYAPPTVLRDLAASLRGFPTSPRDERLVELGTFSPEYAGGGIRLAFRCADRAGHVVADVHIRRPREAHRALTADSVELAVSFEPAALDTFVRALSSAELAVGLALQLPRAG